MLCRVCLVVAKTKKPPEGGVGLVLHALSRIGSSYTTNELGDEMQNKSADDVKLMYIFNDSEALNAAKRAPLLAHFSKTGIPQLGDFVQIDGGEVEMKVVKRVWKTTPSDTTLFIHIE